MRKGLALLLAILLCCISAAAYAQDLPDLSRTGSLNISLRYDGQSVPGGTLTLYRVGEIDASDGYRFVPTGDFADCGYVLDDVDSPALAKALAALAQNVQGESVTIGRDGTAKFDDLALGLYLIVQPMSAIGYAPFGPFLVTIPMFEDGRYVYEVDASPKVEIEKEPLPSIMPRPSDHPGETPEPTDKPTNKPTNKPDEPEKLPQTGQLNWPVPVLAMTGLCLFIVGWLLRFRKETYEK